MSKPKRTAPSKPRPPKPDGIAFVIAPGQDIAAAAEAIAKAWGERFGRS